MTTKICSLCKIEKSVDDYTVRKNECKECRNKKKREYCKSLVDRLFLTENDKQASQPEKVKCECGCEIYQRNLTKHRETEKHKSIIDGRVKLNELTISYYDEDDSYKRRFITLTPEKFKEFKQYKVKIHESNHKILKKLNLELSADGVPVNREPQQPKKEKVKKLIISYRDEDNSYKKKFISVTPDKFREFKDFQGSSGWGNNHKILKELKFV